VCSHLTQQRRFLRVSRAQSDLSSKKTGAGHGLNVAWQDGQATLRGMVDLYPKRGRRASQKGRLWLAPGFLYLFVPASRSLE
jgi:hypothetical protein